MIPWWLACTHPAAPEAAAELRVVPQGMVGVALVGADAAPVEWVTVDELRAHVASAAAEAERVGRAEEGSPGVFFYAFDRERLLYFAGRTHWRCGGLGCWDYVADHLYAVRRGGRVEAALGVDREIALYERGPGGMTMDQARARWGEPPRVEVLQTVGSERWYYPDRTVLFLDGAVAAIEPAAK